MSTINDIEFLDDEMDEEYSYEGMVEMTDVEEEEEYDDLLEDIRKEQTVKKLGHLSIKSALDEDVDYDEEADGTYAFEESEDSDYDDADFEEHYGNAKDFKKLGENDWQDFCSRSGESF